MSDQPAPYLAAVVQSSVIGVYDDESTPGIMRRNAARVAATIDRICAEVQPAPRLFVFPFLCLTGGSRQPRGVSSDVVAVELPGPYFEPVIEACKRNDCYFVTTANERLPAFPGHTFHTGVILGPAGLVLRSPKSQAFSMPGITVLRNFLDEYRAVYGEEAVLPVAKTPIGNLGCLVESEILVPEAARLLRRKGAHIIVHPTLEGYGQGDEPVEAAKKALAYEAGVYLLSASPGREILERGSTPEITWYGGMSTIVAPDGAIVGQVTGKAEGYAAAEIDLQFLEAVREREARHVQPVDELYRGLYGA